VGRIIDDLISPVKSNQNSYTMKDASWSDGIGIFNPGENS